MRKVSIIVPTYNRPDFLHRALLSALKQTYENVEIVVVNDCGSIDAKIVSDYFGSEKIKYFEHETNKGLAHTRNTAILKSSGDYLCYLDDDDELLPNHVECLMSNISYVDKSAVVYSDANYIHMNKNDNGTYSITNQYVKRSGHYNYKQLLIHNIAPPLCFLTKKQIVIQAGLFDDTMRSHEDWDMWLRIARFTTLKYVPVTTCNYTVIDNSNTNLSKNYSNMLETMRIVYDKTRKYVFDSSIIGQQELFYSNVKHMWGV